MGGHACSVRQVQAQRGLAGTCTLGEQLPHRALPPGGMFMPPLPPVSLAPQHVPVVAAAGEPRQGGWAWTGLGWVQVQPPPLPCSLEVQYCEVQYCEAKDKASRCPPPHTCTQHNTCKVHTLTLKPPPGPAGTCRWSRRVPLFPLPLRRLRWCWSTWRARRPPSAWPWTCPAALQCATWRWRRRAARACQVCRPMPPALHCMHEPVGPRPPPRVLSSPGNQWEQEQ